MTDDEPGDTCDVRHYKPFINELASCLWKSSTEYYSFSDHRRNHFRETLLEQINSINAKMESAANAVNKILYARNPSDEASSQHGANAEVPSSTTGNEDTTVDESVAPAVEHETVTEQHEIRDKEAVQRERHQDHYHTTVQPLKDREVDATQHDHVEGETQYREVDNDATASEAKSKAEQARSGFQDETTDGATQETQSKEAAEIGENVHHHLHETVQPVIEKGTFRFDDL